MRRSPHPVRFKRFQFTTISLILGILLNALSHLFDLDYFEYLYVVFKRYEEWELDEAFLVILILLPGVLIDYFISRYQIQVQKRQFLVFRATLYNVNHTVNNLLNQIQYFYYTASEGRVLSSEELEEFEKLIKQADEDIKQLNKIDKIPDDLSDGVSKIRLE
jgi:hypothetical protein